MTTAPHPHYTIIGGRGFVGSHLAAALQQAGQSVALPPKGDMGALEGPLGHVLFCAGTTADFRQRPFDTVDAHVGLLSHVLRHAEFESLTYLSSTRVYIRAGSTAENAVIPVDPADPGDIFNLSKLTGEALCHQSGRQRVHAVRLSNVLGNNFGSDNFVFSLIRDAGATARIHLQTALDSAKDYVHIDDVVNLVLAIARRGTQPTYNVAAGYNLTNADVVDAIGRAIPVTVSVAENARSIRFVPIDVDLVKREFGYAPRSVSAYIEDLARTYRTAP